MLTLARVLPDYADDKRTSAAAGRQARGEKGHRFRASHAVSPKRRRREADVDGTQLRRRALRFLALSKRRAPLNVGDVRKMVTSSQENMSVSADTSEKQFHADVC